MKEVPMIFNSEMVRAELDGRKTQTRRPLDVHNNFEVAPEYGFFKLADTNSPAMKKHIGKWGAMAKRKVDHFTELKFIPAPCIKGDLIYVRETWRVNSVGCYCEKHDANHLIDIDFLDRGEILVCPENEKVTEQAKNYYQKSRGQGISGNYCPSIHMPRWAARIWLEVLDVKLERVQEISVKDALAEGIEHHTMNCPKVEFRHLWDSIYKPQGKGWDANPWVWAITFKVVSTNGKPEVNHEKHERNEK